MFVDVSDKVVVVTGSSRGIGRELVKKFAKEKAKVVINYNESYEDALNLYKDISINNKNCIMIKSNVTNQNEVKKLCKETIKAFGKVDVLINNVGVCSDNLIQLMTEKQWKEVIDINLNSVFFCSRIFSKEMIKMKQGKIINIASFKGQVGSEGQTNYSASKAGVIAFTKALAKELGRFNISVNAICPGFIVTDLNRHNEKKQLIAQEMSYLNIIHNSDDLANFIVFITSNLIQSISGQVFNIDSRL